MKFTQSLKRALNIAEKCIAINKSEWPWIESYSNGREQGFCFTGFRKKLCVAESRHSDSIVIYYGLCKTEDFDLMKNMITEKTYRQNWYGTEDEAVKFILDYFKDDV